MRIEQKALENSVFVPAFDGGPPAKDSLLYFYHFGKTGGTSVSAYLQTLAWVCGKTAVLMDDSVRELPVQMKAHAADIVFGHTVYGDHTLFGDMPSLITVIRDPVYRVISEYFWTYRFEKVRIVAEERHVENFLNRVAEHDYLTRRLVGDHHDGSLDIETALERLSQIKYVTTTPALTRLLSVIGSAQGMPSLWLELGKVNSNETLKADLISRFSDQIRDRNSGDVALFEYAERRRAEIDETYRRLSAKPRRATKLITMHVKQELDPAHVKEARIARGKAVMVLDLEAQTIAKSGAEGRVIQFGTSAKIPAAGLQEFLKALPQEPE